MTITSPKNHKIIVLSIKIQVLTKSLDNSKIKQEIN